MVANAAPVFIRKGHPIDLGKSLSDKNRLFGDGKTVEGFIIGVLSGSVIAILEQYEQPTLERFELGISLSFGALIGDLVGAFIKRRLRIQRGAPAPLLDQLDFVLGAYFISSTVNYFHNGTLLVFGESLPPYLQLEIILTSLYLIPVIHLLTNIAAHYFKLKPNPW
jgi:CDP-2,3-bis-(O-geranylgeranyl)-sn-glycerol synthase